jgi:TPR repeat protein
MKPLIASLFVASIAFSAAAAQQGETIAVLELRSRVHPVAAAELSDRLREAVRRTVPDARIVDREGDADFVVSGKVTRGGMGYRAWIELRDRGGDLVQRASATGSTRRELGEAIEGAAADLLRSRSEGLAGGPLTIAPVVLPEVPAPAEPVSEEGALNLEASANVLVAWDRARRLEARGKENPEEAADAWRRLVGMGGQNPFREIAATRAQRWDAYAAAKHASDTQRERDTARLRKILPLASVTDSAKLEMLVRFAGAYGFDKVSPLVALLPSPELRARAELSLDCEVKEAHACVQLARAADEAKDVKAAVEFLDRACTAGSAEACAEAGDRWLQGEVRDPERAVPALQRGCDSGSAAACVRLARVLEEGDGVPADAKLATDAREKACSAGDGRSCRRLAGMTDEAGRVADLLRKGCDGGDGVSCALASKEPALVQRQLREAAAGAKKPAASTATPARAVEPPPSAPNAPPPRTELTQPRDRRGPAAVGLLVFGAVAGASAVMLSMDGGSDHHDREYRSGRNLVMQSGSQSSSPMRTVLTVAMGGAAVLSTGAALAVIFSKPKKPEEPKVDVGFSPVGVVVSGTFR